MQKQRGIVIFILSIMLAFGSALFLWLRSSVHSAELPIIAAPADTLAGTHSAPPDPLAHFMEDLTSTNPITRTRGQARLAAMTTLQREALQHFATETTDPQITALLQQRLAELDEEAALDPPPISLAFKDLTLPEFVQLLEKATGEPLASHRPRPDPGDLFSLSAKDQPFWSVINDLNHQHPLSVALGPNGWALYVGPVGVVTSALEIIQEAKPVEFIPVHGFVAFATTVHTLAPGATFPQLSPGDIRLDYVIAVDPRLRIADAQFAPASASVDDKELPLVRNTNPNARLAQQTHVWESSIVVHPTDAVTGKSAVIRGSATFSIVTQEASVTLDEPEKHLNEEIDLEGETMTISRFSVNNQRISFNMTKHDKAHNATITVIDGNGQIATRLFLAGGSQTAGFQAVAVSPPFKLRLSRPTKTREVTIPIELHDIVLP